MLYIILGIFLNEFLLSIYYLIQFIVNSCKTQKVSTLKMKKISNIYFMKEKLKIELILQKKEINNRIPSDQSKNSLLQSNCHNKNINVDNVRKLKKMSEKDEIIKDVNISFFN